MEARELAPGVWVLPGAVNCGLVAAGEGVVAIDTGLDRGAANRILRAAEEIGRPVVAIVNTHAHADHHGGNAQLVRRLGLPVHAPAVEEAVIREPRYEPIYLFGGAAPCAGLENRFLQAEPSPVDHVFRPGVSLRIGDVSLEVLDLAGHSIAQVGIRAGGVVFAADAFFGEEPLAKHGVPFLVDAGATRDSLLRLASVEAEWFVPGHGPPTADVEGVVAANLRVIERVWEWLADRLRREPAGVEEILREAGETHGLRIADPTGWVLGRTTILGYLSAMERAGEIRVVIERGRWLWCV